MGFPQHTGKSLVQTHHLIHAMRSVPCEPTLEPHDGLHVTSYSTGTLSYMHQNAWGCHFFGFWHFPSICSVDTTQRTHERVYRHMDDLSASCIYFTKQSNNKQISASESVLFCGHHKLDIEATLMSWMHTLELCMVAETNRSKDKANMCNWQSFGLQCKGHVVLTRCVSTWIVWTLHPVQGLNNLWGMIIQGLIICRTSNSNKYNCGDGTMHMQKLNPTWETMISHEFPAACASLV